MAIDKSNPNTRRLVNYWVKGEGAVKIRWGTDKSFDRCVRHLSDKVRDPKGLCAELHKEATGEWPAEKGVESALEDAPEAVFELADDEVRAALPKAPQLTWRGPIAPIDRLTGDRREFAPGALGHRSFPLPAMFQIVTGTGHGGAVTVATLDGFIENNGKLEGWGRFLDPRIVPEVTRAVYLLKEGIAGPSVDLEPDLTYEIRESDNAKSVLRVTDGTVIGVTFVAKPAFADMKIEVHDEAIQALLASSGIELELTEWDEPQMPEFTVNGSSWKKMPLASRNQAFDADDAIARLIEASGGNPSVFGQAFLWKQTDGDPKNKASYRMPIADVINGKMTLIPHAVYAAAALLSGAHGGLPNVPDKEKEEIRKVITEIYDVLRETFSDPRIMPMWQRGGRQGAQGTGTEGVGSQGNIAASALTAASEGWRPPAAWFANPNLSKPTGLTVTEDGRVFGHLASWNVCHTGIGNACVTAPHSMTDYRYFKVGTVVTDDGANLAVGKITLGGGHASPQYGIKPALEHYDNAGAAVAAVNVGEDGHGVWVAGALLPGVDDARIAQLRLSPLSGDWRRVDGNLELIAALAVNTPGFPVLRASAADDEPEVLLAAGVVEQPAADFVTAEPTERPIRLSEIDEFLASDARREAIRIVFEEQ
jgi:hypothetical protein